MNEILVALYELETAQKRARFPALDSSQMETVVLLKIMLGEEKARAVSPYALSAVDAAIDRLCRIVSAHKRGCEDRIAANTPAPVSRGNDTGRIPGLAYGGRSLASGRIYR